MPQILLSAKGVAKMIRDGCPFGETGAPHVLKASKERACRVLIAQFSTWVHNEGDILESSQDVRAQQNLNDG